MSWLLWVAAAAILNWDLSSTSGWVVFSGALYLVGVFAPAIVGLALTALAIPFSTPVQAGEEIGWRGYLLPRLSARIGLPAASLIVGIIWGCWHLPFFLIAGTDKSSQSFPAYVLGATALSVAMAWLYWRTRGSLLLTMIMHAAVNNTNLVPVAASTAASPFVLHASLVTWLTVALLWLGAAVFLVAMRVQGSTLSPEP